LRAYSEARRAATTDALTGLRNRRYVMPELERMFQRAQREHLRLACLMLDADAFKSVNDTYGHRKGDEVLQSLAERITAAVRKYDLVGRYGGEEFIVLVSGLDPQSVVTMARRLHESVRSTPVAGIELTVSVGVAFASTGDARADDLVHRADTALYAAKRNGRDQVSVDDVAHGSP
jgi:diguanylate cyclase (GGDEF)-like protein